MKANDPVSEGAARAIAHLNDDHDDALLEMVRALGGHPEATAARCVDADRTGLDLIAETPAGDIPVRVAYDEPIEGPDGPAQSNRQARPPGSRRAWRRASAVRLNDGYPRDSISSSRRPWERLSHPLATLIRET
jgi:uncharacterized protein DUF2470